MVVVGVCVVYVAICQIFNMHAVYTYVAFLVQSNLKADHVNNPKKYVYFYIYVCAFMWNFSFTWISYCIYINISCLANCTLVTFPFFLFPFFFLHR